MTPILPAILPASAQLLLTIDPAGEIVDAGSKESQFSVLLDARIDAGTLAAMPEAATPASLAPADVPLSGSATGKQSGNAGGNTLPDFQHLSARLARAVGAGDGLVARAGEAMHAPAAPAALLLVPPGSSGSEPAASKPAPDFPHLTARLARAIGQRRGLSGDTASPVKQASAPEPELMPAPASPADKAIAALASILPTVQAPEPAGMPAVSIQQNQPTSPPPLTATPILPEPAKSLPAAATPGQRLLAKLTAALPRLLTGHDAGAKLAEPPAPEFAHARIGPVETAIQLPPILLRSQAAPLPVTPDIEPSLALASTARPVATVTSEQAAPLAMLPPAAAVTDFTPPLTIEQPAVFQTFPAAAPAPATAPAAHDFAALIDRLVEARQAAQTSLGAQTVTAAISHAEFGQVALQFRQDAEGLSVTMAGADPDLARAVQIAAPASQSGAQTGHHSENPSPQRQDPGQGQPQSQSQQHRGNPPPRFAEDPRSASNPSPRQRGQDDPASRGGIFA